MGELTPEQAAGLFVNYFIDRLAREFIEYFDVSIRRFYESFSADFIKKYKEMRDEWEKNKRKAEYIPGELSPNIGIAHFLGSQFSEPHWYYRDIVERAWRGAGIALSVRWGIPPTNEIEMLARKKLEELGFYVPSDLIKQPEVKSLRKILIRKLQRLNYVR